jgi:hypothetical protein
MAAEGIPVSPFPPADPINPNHYKRGGLEAIQVIEAFELDYYLGSATKYILRAGRKGDRNEDLKKAIWFLERAVGAQK